MVALLKMPSRFSIGGGAERRIFPRKESRARVLSRRLDRTIGSRQWPHLSLTLRDVSLGGLSAVSDAPLSAGERLNVTFPPENNRGAWDVPGRVIRCQAVGTEYRVALEFDPLPAA